MLRCSIPIAEMILYHNAKAYWGLKTPAAAAR
jgi:hypothetical protein